MWFHITFICHAFTTYELTNVKQLFKKDIEIINGNCVDFTMTQSDLR